ncbi:MAG: L-threonylcarbamoyladenylate synthase [Bacteroidota bacterium]
MIGKNLEKARELLRAGALVALPTETVYGLAANALDIEAVLKIFEVKQRPTFDPLIVHLSGVDQLAYYANSIPEKAQILAEKFWPGPLTLVLPKKQIIPDLVSSGLDTVALRVPRQALTLELLQSLDFPLAAPSANPFGYISPTRPQHVADQLGDVVPYILDGGPSEIGLESTILSLEGDQAKVLRFGGLSVEALEKAIGTLTIQQYSSSRPQAPGMLSSHYAPRKPLQIIRDRAELPVNKAKLGALFFSEKDEHLPDEHQFILSSNRDIKEAARRLFAGLRYLDSLEIEGIYAEVVPDEGLGRAINDRLKRAAH